MIGVIQIDGGQRLACLPQARHRSKPTSVADLAQTLRNEGGPIIVFWHINPYAAAPLLSGIRNDQIWTQVHGIVFFRGIEFAGLETRDKVARWRKATNELDHERLHTLAYGVESGARNLTAEFFVERFLDAIRGQKPGELPPFSLLESPSANSHLLAAYFAWKGLDLGLLTEEQLRTACVWNDVALAVARTFPNMTSPVGQADLDDLKYSQEWKERLSRNAEFSICCGDVCRSLSRCRHDSKALRGPLEVLRRKLRSSCNKDEIASRIEQINVLLEGVARVGNAFVQSMNTIETSWQKELAQLPLSTAVVNTLAAGVSKKSLSKNMIATCAADLSGLGAVETIERFLGEVASFLGGKANAENWQGEIDDVIRAVSELVSQLPSCDRRLE